jgi:AraC-like DNA-binding protein
VDFDSLHDEIVMGVKRQFENHYAESYTLEGLAGQFHVSASSLSQRFREATGTSVMHYLQSIRIAAAVRPRMRIATNTKHGSTIWIRAARPRNGTPKKMSSDLLKNL